MGLDAPTPLLEGGSVCVCVGGGGGGNWDGTPLIMGHDTMQLVVTPTLSKDMIPVAGKMMSRVIVLKK